MPLLDKKVKPIAGEKETAAGVNGFGVRICMAISKDGINWDKPRLGKVVEDGHDTNIVFFGSKVELGNLLE